MNNFWQKLDKPIYALAPMAGVADSAFRRICKSHGAHVLYSEMASATALCYDPTKTLDLVKFSAVERPYVVQLFGSNPKHFVRATKIITKEVKPDGIDINFGCPVKKVQKQGAGAILMQDLVKSRNIIKSVIDNTSLPISIKTRTKVNKTTVHEFLDYVKDLDIKTIMIHGRTLSQGFVGGIDVNAIRMVRNYFGGVILANGGIDSYKKGQEVLEATKADGLGIARGALGRPWIFECLKTAQNAERNPEVIKKEALAHSRIAYKLKGEQGIIEMRKHLCWYVRGLPGARDLRKELIKVKTLKEIKTIL